MLQYLTIYLSPFIDTSFLLDAIKKLYKYILTWITTRMYPSLPTLIRTAMAPIWMTDTVFQLYFLH